MRIFFMSAIMIMLALQIVSAEGGNLYLKSRIDYDLDKADVEVEPVQLGQFNIDRARIGYEQKIIEELLARIELGFTPNDLAGVSSVTTEAGNVTEVKTKNYFSTEVRLLYFKWKIADLLTLSAGKMPEVYTLNSTLVTTTSNINDLFGSSPVSYATRFIGAGISADLGMLKLDFQAGNPKEKTDQLTVMAAATFIPEIGNEMKLKVYMDGKLETLILGDKESENTDFSADAFVDFSFSGLSVNMELIADKMINNTALQLQAGVSYDLGMVKPGIGFIIKDLYNMEPEENLAKLGLVLELPVKIAKDVLIIPFIMLKDITGESMDYTFTLRFEFNPSISF